jgi:hypothetical protein
MEQDEDQGLDDYNIAFDILTEAVQKMGMCGITKQEVVPTLVDFTATVAAALAGPDGIKACVLRLGDRLNDLREGTFPVRKN